MGVKKFIKKSVAFVAAAAMALTMVVAPVGAGAGASYADTTQGDNLELSKKIELQQDGNYKIKLESYATGKDITTTTTEPVPLDIVLVLDQSGSMEYDMKDSDSYVKMPQRGYSYWSLINKEYYYKDGNQYYPIKTSATIGLYSCMYYDKDGTRYYLKGTQVQQQKPSSTRFPWETIWTGVLYQKASTRLNALKTSVDTFVNAVEKNAEDNNVDHKIAMVGFASESGNGNNTEILSVKGSNSELASDSSKSVGVKYSDIKNSTLSEALQDTRTDDGKKMLANSIDALDAQGATRTDLGMDMAKRILNTTTESGRKKLVVMFTDGEPTSSSEFENGVANTTISKARDLKQSNTTVYTIGVFDDANPDDLSTNTNKFMNYVSTNYPNAESMDTPNDGSNKSYYKVASSTSEMISVFESIQKSETTSSTPVTLDENAVLRDIISDNFELAEGNPSDVVKVYTWDSKVESGDITWTNKTEVTNNEAYTINTSSKKVDVSGFNYSENYVTKNRNGKKLVVEILVNGLQSGINMESNDKGDKKSGIYENKDVMNAVKNFVSPKVTIPEYSYVLDYGKEVTIPNTDESQSKAYSETTQINSTKAAPSTSTSIKKTYGTFALENNTMTYKPEKINWDGFDSIFSFGKKTNNKYEWSKTNVIPATSVYYEDDFGATTNTDSDVSIVWGGTWKPDKTSDPTEQPQSSANIRYGWDDSYKDNLGYSNGSATKTDEQGATATFTFTGTGVDVYSRTNGDVGLICAELYSGKGAFKDNGKYKPTLKTQYIDNVSSSGDYYQIPTLSFEKLPYGEYTVVITAGYNGTGTSGTYYLDGIRVYNPLQGNATAEKAYDVAGESNAQYIKLRDTLLAKGFGSIKDGDKTVAGSVFIDKIDKTNVIDGTKDDYEKYGPKNEVYLAPGQAIAFEIDGYKEAETKPNVFVGLKALNAKTKATFTCGNGLAPEEEINSSSDLYYPITPTSSGEVIIRNTGTKLLSITKLRVTNASSVVGLSASQSLLSYAQKFDSLKVVENTNTENPSDNDNKDETLDKGDVDIDNPSDNDNNKDDNNQGTSNSIWDKILNNIKHWFRK